MHMLCLESARLAFNSLADPISSFLRRPHSLLRSLSPSLSYSTTSPTHRRPRRALSTVRNSFGHNEIFDYTSGRWLINEALRLSERRRIFNVNGLRRLAAESVHRSPDEIVDLVKLGEGGFNRIFLITMRDGFQMVARIPYPVTVPKALAVASEVATMEFLRSCGLPIPKVYGYSPAPDNASETEYIFMEYVRGTKLSDVWLNLDEQEIISVMRELAQVESRMMSIVFPVGGGLYYARYLQKIAGKPGIPLEDGRFCVGPDTRVPLWYGRRSQLGIDRGPYENPEAALVRGACKEVAYLEQFRQPLLPFQPMRRAAYKYQEQLRSDHIENLKRYLLIAPSLIPRDPALCHFRIRHPDLQQSNIIVSRSAGHNWRIVGLLEWQHASVLPLFLLAGVPERLQNYGDLASHFMTTPSLPENFEDLNESDRRRAKELYFRRLVHYHYVNNTEEFNELHYAALTDPVGMLRRRLFSCASDPWEGETLGLKVALINATEHWQTLSGGETPCPIAFDTEDVRETMKLDEIQREADETLQGIRYLVGFGPEGWVPTEQYEKTIGLTRQMKKDALASAETEAEREEIETHWLFDDMDEEKYN